MKKKEGLSSQVWEIINRHNIIEGDMARGKSRKLPLEGTNARKERYIGKKTTRRLKNAPCTFEWRSV